MANLFIQEYREVMIIGGHAVPVGTEPAVTQQKVAYTTSTAATAFNGATRLIRVIASADAYIKVSPAATATAATANHMLVKANTPEYFGVAPGMILTVYDGTS